jgi:hypothetical protein
MKKMLNFLFWFLCVASSVAFAGNEEQVCGKSIIDIVGQHLGVKNFWKPGSSLPYEERVASGMEDGVIVAQACKSSPQNKNIILIAVAYKPQAGGELDAEYDRHMIVAMVDETKKQIVSSYQSSIGQDAITEVGESSLVIDTGNYRLAKNTRAFGLRFHSSALGASCGGASWGDELTLFVQNGSILQPVLSDLPMFYLRFISGCNAIPDSKTQEAVLTLDVKKSHSNGYADLLITAHINPSYINGRYDLRAKAGDEHRLLRYDGTKYISDKKTKPWWMLDGLGVVE